MRFFRKGITLLLVAFLTFGSPMSTVRAEWTCAHRFGDRPNTDVVRERKEHPVYHNLYIGSYQLYSTCEVEIHTINAVKECMICYANEYKVLKTYEVHSLADDPDHKPYN